MLQGGTNAGLRAYGIGRVVSIGAAGGKRAKKAAAKEGQITVQRFYRPEDISREAAYTSPFTDVYQSEEHMVVDLDDIVAPCFVLPPGAPLPGSLPRRTVVAAVFQLSLLQRTAVVNCLLLARRERKSHSISCMSRTIELE